MSPEKQSPTTQNDEDPSSLQLILRRFDVVDEQLPETESPSRHQRSKTPPPEEDQQNLASQQDSDASNTEDPQEFVYVDLQSIRKEVQCPICLGIIKKTRTVMECLHRFCRECIDKSMRMGNNECPACRTHCPSRRSLRDDPRYDAIIAALYPNLKRFEEEELGFCEEDETRNKQIQESIAQVLQKQSEVVGKKRMVNKDTGSPSTVRNCRNGNSRKRRRRRRRNASPEYSDSDDNNDGDDIDKHFDGDEYPTENKQTKGRSRASVRSSHSPMATSFGNNNAENSNEEGGLSPGPSSCAPETLSWGKGGVRSSTRNSNVNCGNTKNTRRNRIAKLVDFLRDLDADDEEHVAHQTSARSENVQVPDIQDPNGPFDNHSTTNPSFSLNHNKLTQATEPSLQDGFRVLDREGTQIGGVAIHIRMGSN